MKTLWVVNRDGVPNATYEGAEYRLGWWDDESQSWRLNDDFAFHLLALARSLQWGSPDTGNIPNLEIVTRP